MTRIKMAHQKSNYSAAERCTILRAKVWSTEEDQRKANAWELGKQGDWVHEVVPTRAGVNPYRTVGRPV